jgi:hypothetical protein
MISFEKQLHINIPDTVENAEELREEARNLYLNDLDKSDKVEVAKRFVRVSALFLYN